jgi:hypothetical protein
MENRNNLLVILLIAVVILLSWGLSKNYAEYNTPVAIDAHVCKEDSLKKTIDSLEVYITTMEDGFDSKERRYEDVLFEYEFGIDRIRETHPSAYKEFHRIISYRERYSKESERENNKRLNYKDEHNRY